MAASEDQENEHHRGFDYGLIQWPNFESSSGEPSPEGWITTRPGTFTVAEDGYDRHVAHNKERERIGAG